MDWEDKVKAVELTNGEISLLHDAIYEAKKSDRLDDEALDALDEKLA